jgi:hypothetical protein
MNVKFIDRVVFSEIIRLSSSFPVLTITGPRQSGKTTLCKKLFETFFYTNLEDISTREAAIGDPKSFLQQHPEGMIIDEAHHLPALFSYIQVMVDENPDLRFVLTGSSNFALLQNITQSLSGRTALITLLPLSMEELNERMDGESTDNLLLKGFYPAIWSKNVLAGDLYKNYYATYVERDIRQLINLRDINLFRTFIKLCAGRIGCEFNASSIANEIGVSFHTIQNWISILSASYIVHLVPPFYENIGKRLVKSPKIYFYDTGLACFLLGIENENQLSRDPIRGALFENMVVNECLKFRLNRGKDSNIYFYRDSAQHEVDILLKYGLEFSIMEVKSAKTFTKEFAKNLTWLQKTMEGRISSSTVIYDGENELKSETNGLINFRSLAGFLNSKF